MEAPGTIAELLSPAEVDMAEVDRRYKAPLRLVERLIGVVPNCDPILEIWPAAFRSYNLMVPNFLNLPLLLLGRSAPKDVVGLMMFAASRASGCPYCSAHTCSFALRRGAGADKVAAASTAPPENAGYSAAERAAVSAAWHLGSVPSEFTAADRAQLESYFSALKAEWLALSVAMMGFLNKFMDAAGIPLETEAIRDAEPVIGGSGWAPGKHGAGVPAWSPRKTVKDPPEGLTTDTWASVLGVLRLGPSAMALERGWTRGVPAQWPALGDYLRTATGHDFPLLGRMTANRARRALGVMIRDNLTPGDSRLGLATKQLCGLVYATIVQDDQLEAEARKLAAAAGVAPGTRDGVSAFAALPASFHDGPGVDEQVTLLGKLDGLDEPSRAAVLLAKAASPSPAEISPALLARLGPEFQPAAVVELLTWISIQQLMHRLNLYYSAAA